MNIEQPYQPDQDTLARYFSGESGDKERHSVEVWRDASVATREEFARLNTIWLDLGTLPDAPLPDVDMDAAWAKVKQRKAAKAKQSGLELSVWWKIAAAVVLMGGVAYWLNFFQQEPALITIAPTGVESTQLPDGTAITLNSGSELSYSGDFGADTREVTLKGEAFFEVFHDPEKPFSIRVNDALITVLGTSFNVKSTADGVDVAVVTGRVKLEAADTQLILTSGKKGAYLKEVGRVEALEAAPADQYWHTKKLIFEETLLRDVIRDLKQTHRVDIRLEDDQIGNCRLNATFGEEDIETILEVIALSQELTVARENGGYLLSGRGCAR